MRTIVPLQPARGEPRLFLCHGWGGGVSHFLPLARAIGPAIRVYGVLDPGLGDAVAGNGSMSDLVERYADDILRFAPGGRIHLGGFSVGGWYAYEVARALRRRGASVGMLAVLDTEPCAVVPLRARVAMTAPWLGDAIRTLPRRLNARTFGDIVRKTRTLWRLLRSVPTVGFGPALPDEPYVLLARDCVTGRYDGAIDFFRATDCPATSVPMWRALAEGGVRVHPVSADHQSMVQAGAAEIATVMRRILLASAAADSPSSAAILG